MVMSVCVCGKSLSKVPNHHVLGKLFMNTSRGHMDKLQADCKWTSNALLKSFKQTKIRLKVNFKRTYGNLRAFFKHLMRVP